MSHVLLGGDEQQVTELRFLLLKWGVTVGQLPFADDVPTVLDCDAVVLRGKFDEYRDACLGAVPDGSGGAAGPAAPLIFINSDGVPLAELPPQWLVLGDQDQHGAELRLALRSSLNQARDLRGEAAGLGVDSQHQESDSYLHFLGHELRSPLTAIKTSLEVLEGELGGLDRNDSPHRAELKMVDIALRNVRRLHQTVEWSQDLLAAGTCAESLEVQDITVQDLADQLQDVGAASVATDAGGLEVQTDACLVKSLVTQMTRAVSMACPNSPVAIQLGIDPEADHLLQLVVAATDGEHGVVPAAAHATRLVKPADCGEPSDELERLARFMVAPRLVEALDGSLGTLTVAGDRPALVLSLNLSAVPAY